jgi:hypothetical protein
VKLGQVASELFDLLQLLSTHQGTTRFITGHHVDTPVEALVAANRNQMLQATPISGPHTVAWKYSCVFPTNTRNGQEP